nr:MAG TPA: hypothetical protein [Bacteriophage sp.]
MMVKHLLHLNFLYLISHRNRFQKHYLKNFQKLL